jgi:hypothetical protein
MIGAESSPFDQLRTREAFWTSSRACEGSAQTFLGLSQIDQTFFKRKLPFRHGKPNFMAATLSFRQYGSRHTLQGKRR